MTDAELTRAVAERLGWWNIGTYEITSRGVTYRGNPPMMDGDARQRLPDFATDLNAAWPLYCRTPMEWRPDADNFIDRSAAEFARACCEAFLAATEGR